MNTYTIYNSEKILKILYGTEETLNLNISDGESWVEGAFSDEFNYVKNDEIKEYPEKPDFPVNFNLETEQWVWDENLSWVLLRHERDQLLKKNVD